MVLAIKEQIPTEEIPLETVSKPIVRTPAKINGRDQLWAVIRRIRVQLKDLETSISILKRDVARIDRAYYRGKSEIEKARTSENPQDANLLNPGLFG